MLPSDEQYENGYIVLVSPEDWLANHGSPDTDDLALGDNALIFYTQRSQWSTWPPGDYGWTPAISRLSPLGGQFVARIAGTTATVGTPFIREGFTTTASRGAGIRVYEYASAETTELARLQLESLLWMCQDASAVLTSAGMLPEDLWERKNHVLERASRAGLLDLECLREVRAIDGDGRTVCPLCLEMMSAQAFSDRIQQAEGRERFDTTVTQASLFHIRELRVGQLGHRPYNLGWGHHHCNVVAKDAGVPATLDWMRGVVARNSYEG
jgi:BstXI restriction endonuclease